MINQKAFKKNWRIIVDTLEASANTSYMKLPRLYDWGNCDGLSSQLNFMLSLPGDPQLHEERFFKLYRFVAERNPHEVAQWIINHDKTDPIQTHFLKELFNFISNIHVFQTKTNINPCDQTSVLPDEKSSLLQTHYFNLFHFKPEEQITQARAYNLFRMGIDEQRTQASHIRAETETDLDSKIATMQAGDTCHITLPCEPGYHAILVYKINNTWKVFDCEDDKQVPFRSNDVRKTARYVTQRANHCIKFESSLLLDCTLFLINSLILMCQKVTTANKNAKNSTSVKAPLRFFNTEGIILTKVKNSKNVESTEQQATQERALTFMS